MEVFTLTVPQKPLSDAFSAVRRAAAICDDVDKAISALRPVSLQIDGQRGLERRQAELDSYAQDKKEASERALAAVDAAEAAFIRHLDGQTVPDGNELQHPDYALFRDQLITTPQQLDSIMDRPGHKYRAAFRAAAVRLATEKGWKEQRRRYDTAVKESCIRDFATAIFEQFRTAARHPQGYTAFDLLHSGEEYFTRYARSYGVLDEYAKGQKS